MAVHKDCAVVVRSFDLGEADRIVTFCSAEHGRLSVVARGARRPRSRLGGSLQLFNIGELVFFKKANRDLHYINGFDVSEPVGLQLRDPLRVAYASHFAQTADSAGLENHPNPELYALLCSALRAAFRAETVGAARRTARAFEGRLLSLLGYRPHLESCSVCRAPLEPGGSAEVGIRAGGALCRRHAREDDTFVIGADALEAARRFSELPLDAAAALSLNGRALLELKRLFLLLLSERLERRWGAAEYIDALESGMSEEESLG